MRQSSVVAHGLVKRYGEFEAVRGIAFEAQEGACLGFLGPNGAGKTTTMRMISCIAPPSDGTLEVLGMPVTARPREIKARMGVVPQENNLDEEVSVLENLLIYGRYFGVRRRESLPRAEELLRFVALEDKRDWRVPRLSGGMKRRLLIARALLNEPEVLVLDEPTTGLDPQARHLVWEKLRSLKREGLTLLLTTHYMEEAAQLCDRILIMHEGGVIAEGSPRELIARHASPHVVEVFEPDETIEPGLRALEGIADRAERLADRWLFYFIAPGLAATAAMYGASFEVTYNCFVKMEFGKVYDGIMATPLSIEDVGLGELLWATTRALIYGGAYLVIAALLGVFHSWWGLLAPAAVALIGLLFAVIGLTYTALVPLIDYYSFYWTMFLTPMFLFSGIFFPLERLPDWVEPAAWLVPLSHAVDLMRSLLLEGDGWAAARAAGWLVGATAILFALPLNLLRRRLVN